MPGLLPHWRETGLLSMADLADEKRDWGALNLIGADDRIWNAGFKGEGVLYVVGDTGLCRHRDGKPAVFAENFTSSPSINDNNGHGSHVAGTVIAQDNGSGLEGMAPDADYAVLKLLGDSGSNSTSNIVRGYYRLAELWKSTYSKKYRACVFNLSIGGPRDNVSRDGINALWEAGVITIAAMGNSGGSENEERGDDPGVWGIGTAAYDQNQNRANFSSVSEFVIQACPGVNTMSFSHQGDGFVAMSGTSMASPYNSGCWCLIAGSHPAGYKQFRSREGIIEFVKGHSFDLGKAGHDKFYGFGKPDLVAAVPNPLFDGGI